MGASEKHKAGLRIIGSNVRLARKERGLSQELLANMIGVDRPYLSHIENGKTNATIEMLMKIADGLDVPLPSFFAGLEGQAPFRIQPGITYAVVKLSEGKRR